MAATHPPHHILAPPPHLNTNTAAMQDIARHQSWFVVSPLFFADWVASISNSLVYGRVRHQGLVQQNQLLASTEKLFSSLGNNSWQ